MELRLYDPFTSMTFSKHACFLCGTIVTDSEQITVFPEWLQKRYGLAGKKLLLLDQSTVSYQKMQIPCCPKCETLSDNLEIEVQHAMAKGLTGWQELDPKTLYQWLAKIFYGILVTELNTEANPLIKPEHSVGENPKMLQKFQSFFMLLQSMRVPVEFDDFEPGSVFIVPLKRETTEPEFNYRDDITTMMFSLQLDDVMIVTHLLDNGILRKALTPVWREIEGKELHLIQAAEFAARVYYAGYLFNLVPDYFVRKTKPGDSHLIYDTLVDDITTTIFNPWENDTFATALEKFWLPWQLTRQQILHNPDSPLSFLLTPEGKFRELESWEIPA